MQKPLTSRKGLADQIPALIVLQAQSKSQQYRNYELSNYGCQRQEKLTEAIRRRELTEIIEILSLHGFQGDLVIVALRYIQDLGRAV